MSRGLEHSLTDKDRVVILHVTDKLRKKLHLPTLQRAEEPTGAHLRWYSNVFTAERTQYILTTSVPSLFSVVVFGRGITNEHQYIVRFMGELRDHMDKIGMEFVYVHTFVQRNDGVTFAKTTDRSVLGSMNDMVSICQRKLAHEDVSPWDLSRTLNETLFSAIAYQRPETVFREMAVDSEV